MKRTKVAKDPQFAYLGKHGEEANFSKGHVSTKLNSSMDTQDSKGGFRPLQIRQTKIK